jgi:hypothetical protein
VDELGESPEKIGWVRDVERTSRYGRQCRRTGLLAEGRYYEDSVSNYGLSTPRGSVFEYCTVFARSVALVIG